MSSRALLTIAVILLLAGAAYYYFAVRTPGPSPVATSTPSGTSSGGAATSTPSDPAALCVAAGGSWNAEVNECVLPLIIVASPKNGDIITSPLTVGGVARGYWFFEASFPIEITDSAGKRIAQHYAEAQGEWMTTEYVPFKGTISFTAPTSTNTGFVVFHKDNPSGLPQNDASVKVPIRFR
ncbi:MAG TPA: Gmad2 immunoglobulin-like domain-containing protein [Candidatus Paceibacterota bacterium]|nr:Gmad2 immunoglobulin-like domain-containing protein [Candidatus Paceibacterota bacterium]